MFFEVWYLAFWINARYQWHWMGLNHHALARSLAKLCPSFDTHTMLLRFLSCHSSFISKILTGYVAPTAVRYSIISTKSQQWREDFWFSNERLWHTLVTQYGRSQMEKAYPYHRLITLPHLHLSLQQRRCTAKWWSLWQRFSAGFHSMKCSRNRSGNWWIVLITNVSH